MFFRGAGEIPDFELGALLGDAQREEPVSRPQASPNAKAPAPAPAEGISCDWGAWSACSQTCESGTQIKHRASHCGPTTYAMQTCKPAADCETVPDVMDGHKGQRDDDGERRGGGESQR